MTTKVELIAELRAAGYGGPTSVSWTKKRLRTIFDRFATERLESALRPRAVLATRAYHANGNGRVGRPRVRLGALALDFHELRAIHERAACVDTDPELFFDAGQEQAALAICARCDARDACLELALRASAQDQYGVWGGMTAEERKAIKGEAPWPTNGGRTSAARPPSG